jgi:UDP-2,3-diacylglucosamine pyrophosphatase LpxH
MRASSEKKLKLANAAANAAISHFLKVIAEDPEKFFLMGDGTESWAKLTDAASALWGIPVEEIRGDFRPSLSRCEKYRVKRESDEALLRHCRRRGITAPQ